MRKKVILISVDGMRSDGLQACGNPYLQELEKICSYTYKASSLYPTVTLPCHFSMTHSVTPQRHGILTNTYVPQVRPVNGIFELIKAAGGVSAMFYGWEPLRDIAAPNTLKIATYVNNYMQEDVDGLLTEEAEQCIRAYKPDFVFLYLVDADEKGGHDSGWMSDEYLRRISMAIDDVKRMVQSFGEEYTILLVSDHGGHNRSHGADIPEDMVIPMFFYGPDFAAGGNLDGASLLDVAPTIAAVMGIAPEREWEGKSLVTKPRKKWFLG